MRFMIAAVLFCHGWIHAAIYLLPPNPEQPMPFDPHRSWMLSAAHVAEHPREIVLRSLSIATAAGFTLAALGLAVSSDVWVGIAAVSAVLGLLLKGLFFHPWLIAGVLIDVAVLAFALEP